MTVLKYLSSLSQDSVCILLLQFSSLLVEHAAPHIHDSNNKLANQPRPPTYLYIHGSVCTEIIIGYLCVCVYCITESKEQS